MSTKVIEFNRVVYEFVNDIKKCYGSTTEILEVNYIVTDMDTLVNLEYYIDNHLPKINLISVKDECIFDDEIFLLKDINFVDLWKNATDDIKNTIWRYCHTLYILAHGTKQFHKIIKERDNAAEYHKIMENHTELLTNMISYLKTDNETNVSTGDDTNSAGDTNNVEPDNFMNSMIGELAKELSSEINTDELSNITNPSDLFSTLMSGGENSCLNKIVKSVGDKLNNKITSGEINEEQLFNEAQGMIKNFTGSPFDMFNANQNTDSETPNNKNNSTPDMANIMKMAQSMMGGDNGLTPDMMKMAQSMMGGDSGGVGLTPDMMNMAQSMMGGGSKRTPSARRVSRMQERKVREDTQHTTGKRVSAKKHRKRVKKITKSSNVSNDLD
jgi:hypothetical protein